MRESSPRRRFDLERGLTLTRHIRTAIGGDAVWRALRPAYWSAVDRLAGDAGVSMTLSDGHRYRLAPKLFSWHVDTYEHDVVRTLVSAIEAHSVVLDVGAHVGLITLMAARRVAPSSGRVYAFEASPDNFAMLQRHLRINALRDRVTAFNVLVGERPQDSVPFAFRRGEFTANSLAYRLDGSETVALPMVTVDQFVDAGTIAVPDVVKIDVEGYEHAVILGARRTLSSRRPLVVCALHPEPLRALGSSPRAVIAEMAALGYAACNLAGAPVTDAGHEEVIFR